MMRLLAILMAPWLVVSAVAAEPLREYTNARFGYQVRYPVDWRLEAAAPNGANARMLSPDGESSLVCQAHFLGPLSVADFLETEKERFDPENLVVEQTGDRFRIRALLGEEIVLFQFARKGGNWASVEFRGPASVESLGRALLATWEPFLPGAGYDRAP